MSRRSAGILSDQHNVLREAGHWETRIFGVVVRPRHFRPWSKQTRRSLHNNNNMARYQPSYPVSDLLLLISAQRTSLKPGAARLCDASISIPLLAIQGQTRRAKLPLLHDRYLAIYSAMDSCCVRHCLSHGRGICGSYAAG